MKIKILTILITALFLTVSLVSVTANSEYSLEDECNCNNTFSSVNNFQKYHNMGLVKPVDWPVDAPLKKMITSRLPPTFDWRNQAGGLPPCRDQGSCGSCWAFATVGPLECNIKIKDGDIVDLSEQWLLSCNDDGYGCDGGFMVFDMFENDGAIMEDDFKYEANDGISCGTDGPYNHVYKIDDYAYISYSIPSVDEIKQAIYDYGPVACGVYAGSILDPLTLLAWQTYGGGVFSHNGNGETNHAVTLVGWDDNQGTNGVWILRNSWGTGWGEDGGYMRIEYGCCSVGDCTSYVEYPECDLTKKSVDGDDYYWSDGDVKNENNCAILSEGGDQGQVAYKIKIEIPTGYDLTKLAVGFEFRDESWFGNGPDFYVQKSSSWLKLEEDMGKPQSYTNTFRVLLNPDDYVDNDGYVHIKVAAQGDDDTFVRKATIKYELVEPKADLDSSGAIDVSTKPGVKVTGYFTVLNVGQIGSKLDWKVDSYPNFGSQWTSYPSSGNDLTPGSGTEVQVSFYAPNEKDTFSGKIVVINTNDPTDMEEISIVVSTPRPRVISTFFIKLLEKFPFINLLLKIFY